MKHIITFPDCGLLSVDKRGYIALSDKDIRTYSYYDLEGNPVADPHLEYVDIYAGDDEIEDPTKIDSAVNGFYTYTTHDVDEDSIDGPFGLFGIKDIHGNVITEEKFWQTGSFQSGLCPVREVDGLWGCIDEEGKLVLPYIYEDEPRFNKYGVAYGNQSLIDTSGNEIPDTKFNALEYLDEDSRYCKIVLLDEIQSKQVYETGTAEGITEDIYDTKKREYVVRGIPECILDLDYFDGEPDVVKAAAEMVDDYDRIRVEEERFIIGYRSGQIEVYDYYKE